MHASDFGKLIHREWSGRGGVYCFLNSTKPPRSCGRTVVAQTRQLRDHQRHRAIDGETRYGVVHSYFGPNAGCPYGGHISANDLSSRGKRALTIGLAREPIIRELDVEPLPFDAEPVAVRCVGRSVQQVLRHKRARPTANFFYPFARKHETQNRLGVHVERNDLPDIVGAFVKDDSVLFERIDRRAHEGFERHGRRHMNSIGLFAVERNDNVSSRR